MGYRDDGEDDRRVDRCARCDAIVFAEPAGSCHTNANTACEWCGMTMPDLPVVDDDYFKCGYESRPSSQVWWLLPPREINDPAVSL